MHSDCNQYPPQKTHKSNPYHHTNAITSMYHRLISEQTQNIKYEIQQIQYIQKLIRIHQLHTQIQSTQLKISKIINNINKMHIKHRKHKNINKQHINACNAMNPQIIQAPYNTPTSHIFHKINKQQKNKSGKNHSKQKLGISRTMSVIRRSKKLLKQDKTDTSNNHSLHKSTINDKHGQQHQYGLTQIMAKNYQQISSKPEEIRKQILANRINLLKQSIGLAIQTRRNKIQQLHYQNTFMSDQLLCIQLQINKTHQLIKQMPSVPKCRSHNLLMLWQKRTKRIITPASSPIKHKKYRTKSAYQKMHSPSIASLSRTNKSHRPSNTSDYHQNEVINQYFEQQKKKQPKITKISVLKVQKSSPYTL